MYKKTHDVRGRCIDNFMFFRKPLDEKIVCKYVFLSLLFWATNPLFGNIGK